ncbi:hypothetical protein MXD61_20810 [Frankia sp. AgPm24]|uniref:WXG100 family type VII secretion target n=1 Tax=Frankia sp. AgPm24 TaxID=631128 RepID=UPI00201045ED|nr:hypothetical protein [Frankia sp. AgPm24]MCK9924278.1 hypothetical protein [Frankia sp. AgPm24]
MADIKIDYASVDTVAASLNAAVAETVPKLTSLQSAVTALLSSGGGLWLVKSSPVLQQQYTDFNTSVTAAVNNINSFANQFNNIVSQLQAMDSAIASS